MSGPRRARPLRVLIVVTSSQRRGAEIEGTELSRQLVGLGLEARTVALCGGDPTSRLDIDVLGARPLQFRTLRGLRRCARGSDVVVAYGSSTLSACALGLAGTGVPFVYRSIGDPARWVRGKFHRAVWARLYRRAHRIVVLWPGGERSVRELFGVDASRIEIIPNARDSGRFLPATPTERAAARDQLGVPATGQVAAVIGALSEEKQVDRTIDAIAELPAVDLLVAGDGPLRQTLEDHATRVAPGRVRFLGNVDDVRTVLHASDILVMTSRTEGMPGVVIEAAMCGIPTVAPAIGAMDSLIIHEETGMITESTAPQTVARAIDTLFPNAAASGEAARRHVEASCSWTSVAAHWADFLASMVLGALDDPAC